MVDKINNIDKTTNSREQTIFTLESIAQNLSKMFDSEVGEHIPSLPMEMMGSYFCNPERPVWPKKEG